MREVRGEFWDTPAQVKVLTTNGFVKKDGTAVMGAGVAKQAAVRFPSLPTLLGRLLAAHGNRPFVLGGPLTDGTQVLATMPVKHAFFEDADLELILDSARELVAMADRHGWADVLVPRPGCGNGRLDWADVGPALAAVLDDRFTIITW